MTDQELAEIRKRVEAATSGTWWSDGKVVGWIDGPRSHAVQVATIADADFIANASQDVRALLANAEQLRTALRAVTDRWEHQLDQSGHSGSREHALSCVLCADMWRAKDALAGHSAETPKAG